jgi:hypothetical protein
VGKIGRLDHRSEKSAQNASRYCQLLYVFNRLGKTNVVNNLKKILAHQFTLLGVEETIENFSFTHLITLLNLFEDHPNTSRKVKEILEK